ncbi:MAG TPA: hypothetical protein VHM70_11785 [Polyangiaceae bacterium]|nr:hypothetical protein [Polyangiaceae bacterium]
MRHRLLAAAIQRLGSATAVREVVAALHDDYRSACVAAGVDIISDGSPGAEI